ncbi:MAG: MarR family transcriptional regulator [Oscillospiraceae bacterium]|nr:MarR family transcriptional regulator [Oscillospiraceae bacterium]
MNDLNFDSLKLKNQLCFPLYAASREVIKLYRPYLEALNLTYTQYIAMMVFWEEKKISVKKLGKKLYLDSGTLTPVLKSLEAKGYVHRSRSVMDERVLLAEITDEGEKLREQASAVPQSVAGCVKLEPDEAMKLYELLYKILGAVNEE